MMTGRSKPRISNFEYCFTTRQPSARACIFSVSEVDSLDCTVFLVSGLIRLIFNCINLQIETDRQTNRQNSYLFVLLKFSSSCDS